MSEMVYVAMVGVYSSTWVGGVFATPEAALLRYTRPCSDPKCEHKWAEDFGVDSLRAWTNQCDWGSAVEIMEMEVEGDAPPDTEEPVG